MLLKGLLELALPVALLVIEKEKFMRKTKNYFLYLIPAPAGDHPAIALVEKFISTIK